MKRNARSIIRIYFLTVGGVLLLPILFFFIYDPMQVFHKPWGRKATFHDNMRQQAIGIIRNYSFDSIIMGTSMLENTSSKQAAQSIGGKFVNISMSGSDLYERSYPIKYVLAHKPIKNVIYSMDSSYMIARMGHQKYTIDSFNYLYNANPLDDFKVYFNDKFLACLFKWSNQTECIGRKTDLDRPNAWFEAKSNKSRFGGIDHWFTTPNSNKIKAALNGIIKDATKTPEPFKSEQDREKQLEKVQLYLDTYVLQFVAKNPETEFHLIYPPYSRVRFAIWHQVEMNKGWMHEQILRYLARQSEIYPNLHIYAFEDQPFLDNIANYKDLEHYHQQINELFITSIAMGQHRITVQNIDTYIHIAREKATQYNLKGFAHTIDEYLKREENISTSVSKVK